MVLTELQSATQYDDRTTAAVKSVLLEIGQVLGSFQGKFAVVGGADPWLLLDEPEIPYIGTADVDLVLDAEALVDGEYVDLIHAIQAQGYSHSGNRRRFQLVRRGPDLQSGQDIQVVVDFLMPRDAKISQQSPPLLNQFAAQRADGVELALRFHEMVAIEGEMPGGGNNSVRIAVASIPALLAMKGYAITKRLKRKDAYDIYYCIRQFPGGIVELANATKPLLEIESARAAYSMISDNFRDVNDFGPTSVRQFVEVSPALGEWTADQWQQDAFGQVDAWLKALDLR